MAKKHKLPAITQLYMPSFSTRTVVYKGLLLAPDVGRFYGDLTNPLYPFIGDRTGASALFHQHFPSWKLAHPFRFIAHWEINTCAANVNWINARRRGTMESELLGPDLDKMWPLIPHGQSDTASLDNALELLVAGGYPLAHAVMMSIPEAWAGNKLRWMPSAGAFYEYHAALMDAGDGAAIRLHRTAARSAPPGPQRPSVPARYIVTRRRSRHPGFGVRRAKPVLEEKIKRKWRPSARQNAADRPGRGPHRRGRRDQGQVRDRRRALRSWLRRTQYKLEELPDVPEDQRSKANDPSLLLDKQQAFGYTQEDLSFFLEPMALVADDPVGSMGSDTPIAVLSSRPKLLYNGTSSRISPRSPTRPSIPSAR